MRIGYDEECGSVVIVGRDVFPACALRATMDASGKIRVMSLAETAELYTDWFRIETLDGRTFDTPEDAKAYVDGILMRRPVIAVTPPPFTAGEPLSGQRVMRLAGIGVVRTASSDDVSQVGLVLGVSNHAADEGEAVAVTVVGPLSDAAWSFSPGPVFLGLNGALIQAPPSSGFVQQIATATTPTDIVVQRGAPIILAQ